MEKIKEISDKHNLIVIEDACHALGGKYKDYKIQYFPFLAYKAAHIETVHFYGYSVARKFVHLTPEEKQKLKIFNLLEKIQLN